MPKLRIYHSDNGKEQRIGSKDLVDPGFELRAI
jgi:hypothetical protein